MASESEAAANKEAAQKAYDEAYARTEEAQEDLRQKRAELDDFLREEEAERHAVYLGFEEGDVVGIKAARHLMRRRREEKRVLRERAALEPSATEAIGGIS